MELHEELLAIADRLSALGDRFSREEVRGPAERLREAATAVGKSWSGSWIGYHACVYYAEFQAPPPGARFSQDWGFMPGVSSNSTIGDWVERDTDSVEEVILANAHGPDLSDLESLSAEATSTFEDCQLEAVSILVTALSQREDSFLAQLRDDAEALQLMSLEDILLASAERSGDSRLFSIWPGFAHAASSRHTRQAGFV